MRIICSNSNLSGEIMAPPSKSQTIRALLFGMLGKGETIVSNYLESPDTTAMICACEQLGAKIQIEANVIVMEGAHRNLRVPADIVDAKNSGQVLRFVTGIAALLPEYTILSGDDSVRGFRPMQPLLDGLAGLGAFCVSSRNNGYAPIIVKGPILPGKTMLNGEDSQPVSALLIAASFLSGMTEIEVVNPGEKPWIALTLHWLSKLGIQYENANFQRYLIKGYADYCGFQYTVPGDFSSILYPVVAAIISNSSISIHNVDMDDMQGDKQVIWLLQRLGANISWDRTEKVLIVKEGAQLVSDTVDVNDFIDAVTILAVVGCYAEGEMVLVGASNARNKESNRLVAITAELQKMGADIVETRDGLVIRKSELVGAKVSSYNDHRIAMSMVVAGLGARGVTEVDNVGCIAKSYQNFCNDMNKLNANIESRS